MWRQIVGKARRFSSVDQAEALRAMLDSPTLSTPPHLVQQAFDPITKLACMAIQGSDLSARPSFADRLIQMEAVHPFDPSNPQLDLVRRTSRLDRRLFVLVHPHLVDVPLASLHVALSCDTSFPPSITSLLHAPLPTEAIATPTTALFYSITSTQPALKRLHLGRALIHRARQALRLEFPRLSTLQTMSPMPRFAAWLATTNEPHLVSEDVAWRYLTHCLPPHPLACPVAHFHRGNGAKLHHVLLNTFDTERGSRESRGVMASYLY